VVYELGFLRTRGTCTLRGVKWGSASWKGLKRNVVTSRRGLVKSLATFVAGRAGSGHRSEKKEERPWPPLARGDRAGALGEVLLIAIAYYRQCGVGSSKLQSL